jgi:aminoglycoside phosphotransferase (APT) family kinase protein
MPPAAEAPVPHAPRAGGPAAGGPAAGGPAAGGPAAGGPVAGEAAAPAGAGAGAGGGFGGGLGRGAPGIDVAATTAWFAGNVPQAPPPLDFQVIAGGRSNLTYLVRDAAGGSWVLRRPPLSGVLPSAHDMGREHRIISALLGTPVPVPEAIGLCEDPGITGVPFYVMRFVEGVVPRNEAAVRAAFDERQRATAAESLVEVLVALHAVEPAEIGLGDLGRRDGYIERQLRRWTRQWEQSKTRELPAMDEAGRRLAERVPAQQGPGTIVHGDYRLDNLILSPAGTVAAVLDWELCTLGDPLADLGLLMVYWSDPGDDVLPLDSTVTALPGFPRGPEVADAYARRSGRDLSELDYYVAFGYWKLAAILEGVYARSAAGAYGRDDDTYRRFATVVELLAARALDAITRAGG